MNSYGQYCPVAMATEILGDRWTLLIVRDLLTGVKHFNDLERGLPGISRGLLSDRLKRLEFSGVLEKYSRGRGRKTEYRLTAAGKELQDIVQALMVWGARWAFDDPSEEQLDPLLLMWWMRSRVHWDRLPLDRVVIQFDFYHHKRETYWLVLTSRDASICLTHPGFDTHVLVRADLSTYFKVWLGKTTYRQAVASADVQVEAIPKLQRDFQNWFAWSPAAPAVQEATIAINNGG